MELVFKTNDYLLAWYLLFKPSTDTEFQKIKLKLWKNYTEEYKKIEKDNVKIMQDTDNFIPNNDLIYDKIFETDYFKKYKQKTDKNMFSLREAYDINKKVIDKELKEILKHKIRNTYEIIIMYPELNISEYVKNNPKKVIVWGRKEDEDDSLQSVLKILYTALKYELSDLKISRENILSSIIDMIITNELQSRLLNKTCYEEGFKKLLEIKHTLYPYFLMYLGIIEKEELIKRSKYDNIKFDIKVIENGLAKVDIKEFITFCDENYQYLIH